MASRLADPRRIVVIGASWGGYLALGAMTGLGEGAAGLGIDVGVSHCGAAASECDSTASRDASRDEGRGVGRYAAVVAIVPMVCVGAANKETSAFRGDPLVRQYWRQVLGDAKP